MPRGLLLCTTIVAAFELHLAAASSNVVDAPVAPAVAALAARIGLDPAHDAARFVPEITRVLYSAGEGKQPLLELLRSPRGSAPADSSQNASTPRVPLPLPAETWSRAIFKRPVGEQALLTTILADRRAALICRGLSGLDDETLDYVANHPALLTMLYEQGAPAFGAFADAFHVAAGRVVPTGGSGGAALWEAVLREPLSAPDRAARALFADFGGRRAYVYWTIAASSPRAAAFALGSWIADADLRRHRFQALVDVSVRGYHEWHLEALPFSKPLNDLGILLMRVAVDPSGAPLPPAARSLWAAVFDITDQENGPFDAAWLTEATALDDMYSRGERLDAVGFAQRVFGSAPSDRSREIGATLKEFRQQRMLLLTLERMGIGDPSLYAAAVAHARSVADDADGSRRFWVMGQFQGAMALIARLQRVGTITPRQGEALVRSLIAVRLARGAFEGGIAQWLREQVGPLLPEGATWDDRVVAAIAGPSAEPPVRVYWEGQAYRLDPASAERQRLTTIREKQAGHTIDLALALDGVARALEVASLTADGVRAAAAALKTIADESADRLRRPVVQVMPPGVEAPRDGLEWATRTADEIAKAGRGGDLRRAARFAASIHDLAGITLGDALVSLIYAADIGDPDGAPLLAGNVALRHDFGFLRRDVTGRARGAWTVPRQDFMPGIPWHVTGSLLGLDVALAPLLLRRTMSDGVADAPKVPSVEREAFAAAVSLMDSPRHRDRDRDAIAVAVAAGRERVRQLAAGARPLDEIADALGFDGWRRRAVAWTLQRDPAAVATSFSLAELLVLGGGAAGADLDAWGAPGAQTWGCACLRFPPVGAWRILAGRQQQALIAASLVDLQLEVALMLAELRLPAGLARPVMASAMQDFLDRAAPTDAGDWWSLSKAAQAMSHERFEDFVATAAAVDGPLVPEETGPSRQP
jgi:hypothetical protein